MKPPWGPFVGADVKPVVHLVDLDVQILAELESLYIGRGVASVPCTSLSSMSVTESHIYSAFSPSTIRPLTANCSPLFSFYARTNSDQRFSASASASFKRGSASPGGLDGGDVYLLHGHHRREGTLGLSATCRHRFHKHARRDLPVDPPAVLAPAALTLRAPIANDRVPVAVGFFSEVTSRLKSDVPEQRLL